MMAAAVCGGSNRSALNTLTHMAKRRFAAVIVRRLRRFAETR